ncbi:MAG TPA: hypothetical protein VK846_17555 [Candidatus Limnocylindria bacterium]|nr:hypothetical protein [Candidatus Limnocylindria bacterium]
MNALRNLLLLAVVALVFTACKSTEPENMSERPWNAQQGWQTGLPSTINQGR